MSITKWTEEEIRLGLVDAIRRGYIDFIELFLEYGLTFGKLTVGDMEYLYSTASVCLFIFDNLMKILFSF